MKRKYFYGITYTFSASTTFYHVVTCIESSHLSNKDCPKNYGKIRKKELEFRILPEDLPTRKLWTQLIRSTTQRLLCSLLSVGRLKLRDAYPTQQSWSLRIICLQQSRLSLLALRVYMHWLHSVELLVPVPSWIWSYSNSF